MEHQPPRASTFSRRILAPSSAPMSVITITRSPVVTCTITIAASATTSMTNITTSIAADSSNSNVQASVRPTLTLY